MSLVLTLAFGAVATAQDQTPRELPFTPDPELCQAEPRSVDELVALTGTPEAETLAVGTPERAAPEGEPADTETVGAVTATIIEAIACINGGETFRFLGLVSDDALPQLVGGTPLDAESLRQAAERSGTPFPEDQLTTLIDVRDVRVDGDRVSALVEASTGDQESQVDLIFFVEEDGVYLIDGVVEDVGGATGTPAA